MSTDPRLSDATSARLPDNVARPGYDRAAQRRGIVHIGIGAFHRAHQAVYTDDAIAAGDHDWSITGVSLRSAGVRDALAPQDGLYTVTERDQRGSRTRLIGSVRDVTVARETPDAAADALASPDTHIVTLTVTEKGYCRRPDGALDLAAVDAGGETLYHLLAAGLGKRRAAGLPGLTMLSCDNLPDNGGVLRAALAAFLDRHDPELGKWVADTCAFPASMVDRIVPAATDAGLHTAEAHFGLRDAAALVTEPFRQWVIEDKFAGPRPRWERVGAQLVRDVKPYETAKLRLLNGGHSALANLGLAAGHSFVHEAIADPAIRSVVAQLMRDEARASIDPAPGQDLSAYIDALLARFANSALPHSLRQISADGSQKIGPRWLDPLAVNRARGQPCPATLKALAAWIVFVRGDIAPVDDPLAAALADLWRGAGSDGIVETIFGSAGLIPAGEALDGDAMAVLKQEVARSAT